MEADTTSEVLSSDSGSTNGSTNGSNGDYEFISSSYVTSGQTTAGVGDGPNGEAVGSPVQIVKVSEDRHFELDLEALQDILLRDNIKDTPVVVVSIAGDFRKGKSFMLNFFLRYLQSGAADEWLGDRDVPLKGFSWRGGTKRDTTGILMWSEPFLFKLDSGKEVAVLLMDTQGGFDFQHTVRDSANVFALSTMTSSIQVFNLMYNLQGDNLQVLSTFTDYGRLAQEASDETPFQKLVFLIRDWSFAYEYAFGLTGGQKLLEEKLTIDDNQPIQLQRVIRLIRSCFSEINCYLMPPPGKGVVNNPRFVGHLDDIDSEFVDYLRVFVPLILHPNNLIVKKICGREVTGKQLLEYFKVYSNVFAGDQMPGPKCMLEATAEASNVTAVAMAKDSYMSAMEEICGGEKPFLNPKTFEAKHKDLRVEAMELFDKTPKIGGQEVSDPYREQLEMELEQAFKHFEGQNNSKNMFNMFGTPMVLMVGWVVLMILSNIFGLLGLTPVANLTYILMTTDAALLIAYLFCRYSGNYPEVLQFIDYYSEVIWRYIMDICFKFMQNAVENRLQQNITNTTLGSRSPALTPSTSTFGVSSHPLSVGNRPATSIRRSPSQRQ